MLVGFFYLKSEHCCNGRAVTTEMGRLLGRMLAFVLLDLEWDGGIVPHNCRRWCLDRCYLGYVWVCLVFAGVVVLEGGA